MFKMNSYFRLYLFLCFLIFGVISAIQLDAADEEILLQSAQQLARDGRLGEALIAFSQIVDSEVSSQVKAQAAAEAGNMLTLLGQFDEAVVQLESALTHIEASRLPDRFQKEMAEELSYRLANTYALAGRWEQAKSALLAYIKNERTDFDAANQRIRWAQQKINWLEERVFSDTKLTVPLAASLIAFFLTISLCVYIFAKDPLSYVNLSLSFFTFGFALWQLSDAIHRYTLQPETALFWGKMLITGIVLVCLANLNFILLFSLRRFGENFLALRWFFVALPPATLITLVPTNLYTGGADLFFWQWETQVHGWVSKLFFLYIALYVIYGIVMVARANRTISTGAAAKPITYMFFTLGFIFVPSLVAVIVAPLWKYGGFVIGASSLTVIVMAVGLIYSIRRYHVIDVNAVLSKSLVYFVLTGLLLGGYVLLVNLFSELLRGVFGIQTSFWAYVTATLVVSILFQFTRHRVQLILDRLFHRAQLTYQRTLLDFSQAMTTILDLNRLYRLLVNTVTDAMAIDRGWLLIENEHGRPEVVAAVGLDESQKSAISHQPSALSSHDPQALSPAFRIRLQQEGRLIGELGLGRKYSGKSFTRADRELLEILANQAAVAITNAKLVSQLRRADQLTMLGRLSAGIAHEVRNPLLSIKGAAQFLKTQLKEKSEAHEFTEIIISESDRINQLITQFLDYARPAKPHLQPTDIINCLERTLTLLRVEFRGAKVELVRHYTANPPKVLGDEKQLGQLFLNLILNAIEAMPQGGELRVGVHHQGDFCFIKIVDTGTGMSREEQTRIFEPFYTSKEHGLGLGLAIVQELVSQHEGTITVESEKGKGTTFTIGLRVAAQNAS